jgi:hypothetical protein
MHNDDREHKAGGPDADAANGAVKPEDLDQRIDQALADAPAPEAASPEPPAQEMLAGAYARAAAQPAAPAPGRRRWLLAGGTLALAAVVIAVLMFWPLRFQQDGGGVGLDRAAAWASTEGYVIDFDLLQQLFKHGEVVPDGLDVHSLTEDEIIEMGLDRCNQILFARVMEDWIEGHLKANGTPPLVANLYSGTYSRFVDDDFSVANCSYTLLSEDQAVLDDLLATLRRLPGVSEPHVYAETLYFSEKYPGLYTPDRKVIVNGKVLSFPQDIPDAYLQTIHALFSYLDKDYVHYRSYWKALAKAGKEPLAAGDVIAISFNADGDMLIATVAEHWDCGWYRTGFHMSVPKDEIGDDFDPLPLLQKKADMMNDQTQFEPENWDATPSYVLKFNLFAKERLRNVFAQKLSSDELAQSRTTYERMLAAYNGWLDGHPELKRAALRQGKSHIKHPAVFGDGVLQVIVQLKTADENLLAELTSLLVSISGGIQPEVRTIIPTAPQPAEEGGHITLIW